MLLDAQARRVLCDNRMVAGVSLSPRQLECLQWAARGKSKSDIGCILDIATRTVTYHIETATAKLDVRMTSQAVALLSASKPNFP